MMYSEDPLFRDVVTSGGTIRITYVDKMFPSLTIQKLDSSGNPVEGIEVPVRNFGDVSVAALTLIAKKK